MSMRTRRRMSTYTSSSVSSDKQLLKLFFVMTGSLCFLIPSRSFVLKGSMFGSAGICFTRSRSYHGSSSLSLNRFLFDPSELNAELTEDEKDGTPVALLGKDDYRTIHAAKVLNLANGDHVRAGIVSSEENRHGLWTDVATVEWIPEGKVKKAEILKNGNPPGSLRVRLNELSEPDSPSDQLHVSLILALPRPLQLGRMLPMISQMGVDHLILTQAAKVPKDYFGSHLFRKPEVLRERLVEGLCQAGDVRLPQLHIVRNLRRFLRNDMDELFPTDTYARVVAHPQRPSSELKPLRMKDITFPDNTPRKVVIAVGPEGGWEEPDELDRFQDLGFQQITLGKRTLRSDCAVISLLGLANEVCVETASTNHP